MLITRPPKPLPEPSTLNVIPLPSLHNAFQKIEQVLQNVCMDNENINLLICGYDIENNFMFNASNNNNNT
jgi:hypothetical protein